MKTLAILALAALASAGCAHKPITHPALAPATEATVDLHPHPPTALAVKQAEPKPTCVLHDKDGNPTLCLPYTAKIAFVIPVQLIDVARAESKLIDMLLQNLTEMQAGILNLETERKIKDLSLKIEKEFH